MGYKFKPNKSVKKRFGVSKTGKIKRHHSFTSHLMSSRSANKRRKLRQPEVLFEGHAKNMRQLMGISGVRPNQIAHRRRLKAQKAAKAAAALAAPAAPAAPTETKQ
jgi:large subunit ribosomal protein L35